MKKLRIDFVESIEEIGSEIWNELAGIDNPFTRYEFLHSLESTGCTTDGSRSEAFASIEAMSKPSTPERKGSFSPTLFTTFRVIALRISTFSAQGDVNVKG